MGVGTAQICARYDESDNLKPPRSNLHTEMENLPQKLPARLPNQICSSISSCCHCVFLWMWRLDPKLAPAGAPRCGRALADFDKLNPADIWQ